MLAFPPEPHRMVPFGEMRDPDKSGMGNSVDANTANDNHSSQGQEKHV